MSDKWFPILVTCLFLLFLPTILSVLFTSDWYACKSRVTKMEKEYSWDPIQGCMLKYNGQWVLLDKFRVID